MAIRQPRKAVKKRRSCQNAVLLMVVAATAWTTVQLSRLMMHSSNHAEDVGTGFLPPIPMKNHKKDSSKNNDENNNNNDDDTFIIDRVREDPIPNPPLSDGQTSFAACLLFMDDNHRMAEWLAYHYYVLPLRYLIVAVDPRSDTSPTMLLNKWRRMGMYILEWGDADIWGKEENVPRLGQGRKQLTDVYLKRQPLFYGSCTKQAKADNRTWVTMHDSDEYIVYTHKGGDAYEEWDQKVEEERQKNRAFRMQPRARPSRVPPTTAEEGSILSYMRQEAEAGWKFFNSSCIICPRLLFGGMDDTSTTITTTTTSYTTNPLISSVVDPDRLDTLRFRRHANPFDEAHNGNGKAMMDVSKFDHIRPRVKVHVAMEDKCPRLQVDYWQSGLTVNHYLGSWEAYAFRNDSRRGGERTWEAWRFKSEDHMTHSSDIITPWIEGFIRSFGTDTARDLLQGAGLPRGYQSSILSSNWNSEYLNVILNSTQPDRFQAFVRKVHEDENKGEGTAS